MGTEIETELSDEQIDQFLADPKNQKVVKVTDRLIDRRLLQIAEANKNKGGIFSDIIDFFSGE